MVKLCPRRAFWEASRLVDQLRLIRNKRINLHLHLHLQGNSYSIHHIPEGRTYRLFLPKLLPGHRRVKCQHCCESPAENRENRVMPL